MNQPEICARCEKFSLKADAEKAAQGIGLCSSGQHPPISPWLGWKSQACVLFDRAKDTSRRNQWIAKHEEVGDGSQSKK